MAHVRELGAQLSTTQRLSRWARTLLGVAALALAGWSAGLPALCVALLIFWLLFRLLTLFEAPMFHPAIIVTETDSLRLSNLIDDLPSETRRDVAGLEHELERAQVVSARQVPADVVTMNSRVRFEELHSGARIEARLVYPSQSTQEEAISVLAPVGSALLGLSVGHAIDWRMPNGRLRRFRVVELLYQPEAAGDLQL
ncbi:MAG TPA: nucleoside diphosphate kinase regulator [Polyangiales bacterium]|nr:nucleoside diphosphate kinase regulator [Polyangiales bacterium]